MSTETEINDSIERAATSVGPVWPLHSFVTANPLAGFESRPFHEAVRMGGRLFGGHGYPSADVFRRAWESGQIDPDILAAELADHGYTNDPDALLTRMASAEAEDGADDEQDETPEDRVDQVLTKWLAAFLDEGQADWPMPNREQGFYHAVRTLARYDGELPDRAAFGSLPDDPVDALERLLSDHPKAEWEHVFEYHLAALPGWTGLVRQRVANGGAWQSSYPITLAGYLAVRLALADGVGAPLAPPEGADTEATARAAVDSAGDEGDDGDDTVPLPEVWLTAWETTYREELVAAVTDEAEADTEDADRPAAQLVFCIDTRSEVIRRHVEAAGPYETHGYAGFFGIPMQYKGYDADVAVDACPPIVDATHRITNRPAGDATCARDDYDGWRRLREAGRKALKDLTSNAVTAFSFVESAGAGYGAALAARTLLPARVADALEATDRTPGEHEFCEPSVAYNPDAHGPLREGLTLDEQVEYAATAFELMGWTEFARVVVFTGHASETANNPFESSLDCGACAGNPGGPNARVLAAICNDEAVREALRDRGFDIPADTVFVAGEHNTTTDEVTLYDRNVPQSHEAAIERLRESLATARAAAAAERTGSADGDPSAGVRETERRAADWAETRPEWGLAGNASFVVGPRDLTADLHLGGRSFLHSYDPAEDQGGAALESIMTGPMVVTQWINTQYYFASVDNAVYGSGSKVTQNPVGNVGVYQGNGGDLMTGLPLQSLLAADDVPYHQPLRLSVVLYAPVDRVTEVLDRHAHLAGLAANGWLSLTVVDPEQDDRAFHYDGELSWVAREPARAAVETEPAPTKPRPVADD